MLGEMAVITGSGTRNASVIAKTPLTLCVFSEETFKSFIVAEGFQDKLLQQWSLRPAIARQPQFANITSTALEKSCHVAESLILHEGDSYQLSEYTGCLLADGEASRNGKSMYRYEDYGARPFAEPDSGPIFSKEGCTLILFDAPGLDRLRMRTPQLNYNLRKLRSQELNNRAPWILGPVDINN